MPAGQSEQTVLVYGLPTYLIPNLQCLVTRKWKQGFSNVFSHSAHHSDIRHTETHNWPQKSFVGTAGLQDKRSFVWSSATTTRLHYLCRGLRNIRSSVLCMIHTLFVSLVQWTGPNHRDLRTIGRVTANAADQVICNFEQWSLFPERKQRTWCCWWCGWSVLMVGICSMYACLLWMYFCVHIYEWYVCIYLCRATNDHHVLLLQKLGPCLLRTTQIRWYCKLESLQKLISRFSTSPKTKRSKSW